MINDNDYSQSGIFPEKFERFQIIRFSLIYKNLIFTPQNH